MKMKRAFLKTAFVASVLVFMMILLVPAMAAMEALFPAQRGADGLYRGGDRLFLAIPALLFCSWVADRIISRLFRAARITDDRWSIFRS
jgi:hypothetical protein